MQSQNEGKEAETHICPSHRPVTSSKCRPVSTKELQPPDQEKFETWIDVGRYLSPIEKHIKAVMATAGLDGDKGLCPKTVEGAHHSSPHAFFIEASARLGRGGSNYWSR